MIYSTYKFLAVKLVERALSTNDNENGFASIVRTAGGWKPPIQQLMAIQRNIDFTATIRRMQVDELGFHPKQSNKGRYKVHYVQNDPTLTWNDGSGKERGSVGQNQYQSNVPKRTKVVCKGSQITIQDHHIVKVQDRGHLPC
jgi:hypothetical protein